MPMVDAEETERHARGRAEGARRRPPSTSSRISLKTQRLRRAARSGRVHRHVRGPADRADRSQPVELLRQRQQRAARREQSASCRSSRRRSAKLQNDVVIEGHTDSAQYVARRQVRQLGALGRSRQRGAPRDAGAGLARRPGVGGARLRGQRPPDSRSAARFAKSSRLHRRAVRERGRPGAVGAGAPDRTPLRHRCDRHHCIMTGASIATRHACPPEPRATRAMGEGWVGRCC